MKKNLLFMGIVALIATACNYNTPTTYIGEKEIEDILTKNNGRLYTIQQLKDSFMSEEGNYTLGDYYRTRAHGSLGDWWLFNIDTLPDVDGDGKQIYLRGRLVTDDYGGNFYKTLILQQVKENGTDKPDQECLRIGVDMGSASGLYQKGQEVLICCKGLSLGRYGNQEQLCVPSYNNNTMAQHADQKIGWMPGRIPAPIWRKAITLIGLPDQKKIVVEELTPAEAYTKYISKYEDVQGCRQYDARVVRIKGVTFTGQYADQSDNLVDCNVYQETVGGITGDPTEDEYTNVLAPTTKNVGYPQSRIFKSTTDQTGDQSLLVSCSEYTKYAHYYIPCDTTMTMANKKTVVLHSEYKQMGGYEVIVSQCVDSVVYTLNFNYGAISGNVCGILSYFMDNAGYAPSKFKWSISTEDIKSFELKNTVRYCDWEPIEFAKSNFYRNSGIYTVIDTVPYPTLND